MVDQLLYGGLRYDVTVFNRFAAGRLLWGTELCLESQFRGEEGGGGRVLDVESFCTQSSLK